MSPSVFPALLSFGSLSLFLSLLHIFPYVFKIMGVVHLRRSGARLCRFTNPRSYRRASPLHDPLHVQRLPLTTLRDFCLASSPREL